MLKFLITAVFILFSISNAIGKDAESAFKLKTYEPMNMPDDVAVFDADGNKHFLEEYEGQTIMLVFWATWCSPCVNEMVDLDNLQKDFRKLKFLVIPVSQDYTGVEQVKKFYNSYNLRHLPVMHDYKNALFKALEIAGLPTSIVIGPDGKAIATFTGAVPWYDDKVRETLLSYISGNPATPKNSYKDRSLNQRMNNEPIKEKKDEEAKLPPQQQ